MHLVNGMKLITDWPTVLCMQRRSSEACSAVQCSSLQTNADMHHCVDCVPTKHRKGPQIDVLNTAKNDKGP